MWSIDLLLGGNWVCYQRCRSLMAHVLTFYTLSPLLHFSLRSLSTPTLLSSFSHPLAFNLSLSVFHSVFVSFLFFLHHLFSQPILSCAFNSKIQLAWLLIINFINMALQTH